MVQGGVAWGVQSSAEASRRQRKRTSRGQIWLSQSHGSKLQAEAEGAFIDHL